MPLDGAGAGQDWSGQHMGLELVTRLQKETGPYRLFERMSPTPQRGCEETEAQKQATRNPESLPG